MKHKNSDSLFKDLLSRNDYLIVQGNDLARSFGNLSAFEHRLLDFCFSYVTADSIPNEKFQTTTKAILQTFGIAKNGKSYKQVAKSFKRLNENTALYFVNIREDGKKSIIMSQLFSYIEYVEDGVVEFKFSEIAQPYVFDLKKNFYSFHLRELVNIKGKYALILMKIWGAKRYGNNRTTIIEGSLEDFQEWFLGSGRRIASGQFKSKVLEKAIKELETKFHISIVLETQKSRRIVIGYKITINDGRLQLDE